MPQKIKLSELVEQIEDAIQDYFAGETFWVTAEICDVRKKELERRCYLKFIEKEKNEITTEIRGVFWANSYSQIENFEKLTREKFTDGIKITCNVRVRFHPKYGLNLDVLEIDLAHALGTLEMERQQTLERLLKENPEHIFLSDEQYKTFNNRLPFPPVIQRIALVTAPASDGQRDFKKELEKNRHGYAFSTKEFLTTVQGNHSHKMIRQQLKLIEQNSGDFDVVVIVRGGGSLTDFKPFDDYELSKHVACFPVPILTGIGHDRNTSIVDLMARQHKTPTKVATFIIDHNFNFENSILSLKERLDNRVNELLERAKKDVKEMKRLVKSLSPTAIVNRGFAIVMNNGKVVTNPACIQPNDRIQTILKNETIHSTVTNKTKDATQFDV